MTITEKAQHIATMLADETIQVRAEILMAVAHQLIIRGQSFTSTVIYLAGKNLLNKINNEKE